MGYIYLFFLAEIVEDEISIFILKLRRKIKCYIFARDIHLRQSSFGKVANKFPRLISRGTDIRRSVVLFEGGIYLSGIFIASSFQTVWEEWFNGLGVNGCHLFEKYSDS